jgi:hypothetical protein
VSGWQSDGCDPARQGPATPPQWQQPQYERPTPQQQPRYEPRRDEPQLQPRPVAQAVRKTGLTAAESFWYVMGCIAFGAMYFAKIPSKKALADFGMAELTAAESFWYVLMCIAFGGGYFAKIPTAKAISELPQFRAAARPELEYRR